MALLDVKGDYGSESRPARKPDSRKPWFKDPTSQESNNGTRIDATFMNDLVALVRATLTAFGVSASPGDDDALADAVAAAVDVLRNEIEAKLGAPQGIATLDSGSKVPIAQLPATVIGSVNYQGTWNANTNSPALASGVGTKGYYYRVATAGTTALNGISEWAVGDWVIYSGSAWEKVDNTDQVVSVAGLAGTISAAALKTALAIAVADITDATANGRSLISAANYGAMRTLLSLGTAALLDVGTTANKVVQLDNDGKLPPVDGSLLTGISAAPVSSVFGRTGAVVAAANDYAVADIDGLSAALAAKLAIASIINDLTTGGTSVPLSAAQGVALKALIDAIGTPSLKQLASGTVTSAATLDIVLSSYTGYRAIIIELIDLIPATDDVELYVRVSTNAGSSYDAGGSDYMYSGIGSFNTAGPHIRGSAGAAQGVVTTRGAGGEGIGSGAAEGAHLKLFIPGQVNTAIKQRIQFETGYYTANDQMGRINGWLMRAAAQDTDAIRVLCSSSSNIASAKYAVYGLL